MGEGDNPYIKGSQDAAKEYDSRLFWLAGGAITLTFTLANSIAASRALVSLGWLAGGIAFFSIGLFMAMASYQFSVHACNAWVEYQNLSLARQNEETTAAMAREECRARLFTGRINFLNWAALAAMAGGVLCVSVFATDNLSKGVTSAGSPSRPITVILRSDPSVVGTAVPSVPTTRVK